MTQATSIRYLKGVGESREKVFNKLGVSTIRDLFYYFPFRYEDRTNIKKISELKANDTCLTKGLVKTVNLKKIPYFVRKNKIRDIFEIILSDDSGSIRCVWFNQGYLSQTIKKGDEVIVYGKLYLSKRGLQFSSPQFEKNSKGDDLGVGRIVGVYRLPSGVSQRFMRLAIDSLSKEKLHSFADPIPFNIRKNKDIPNIVQSLRDMHFPSSWQAAGQARERFIFEELFFSQILVYLRKARRRLLESLPCKINPKVVEIIRDNFHHTLTAGQEKTLREILNDLSKPYPMHRLLQGDVGCGKTLIAALAIGVCAEAGLQAACMVPTEVLARQHYQAMRDLFKGLAIFKNERSIRLITSSTPAKDIKKIHQGLSDGSTMVVIGTHALIQDKINFKNLGLIVIDEQHKFGVAQRSLLSKKGKPLPHCLVMSATPIPRTLALSLYGDLDLSLIPELPPGRITAQTLWLGEDKRQWAYDFMDKEIERGRQAYIVYPIIEESQDDDLKSLLAMHRDLGSRFKQRRVAMFHGKMSGQDKQASVEAFREKKIDILLCTTVVEVGVSIDNATVMIVENPERFGLAQLHQLRGRIQRCAYQPHFILISRKNLAEQARQRLKIISQESSGFKIAEHDLLLRGPGDFFGDLQHGLPDLKIANPLRDIEVLRQARRFAYATVKSDPCLETKVNQPIRSHLSEKFSLKDYFALLDKDVVMSAGDAHIDQ